MESERGWRNVRNQLASVSKVLFVNILDTDKDISSSRVGPADLLALTDSRVDKHALSQGDLASEGDREEVCMSESVEVWDRSK